MSSVREEALAQFSKTPFFARWNPHVLEVYAECGLVECEDGPGQVVRLKMPPLQEAVVFAETRASYEAWELLGQLSEDVELRWMMPGEEQLA